VVRSVERILHGDVVKCCLRSTIPLVAIAKAGASRSGLDAGLLKRQYLEGLSVAIRRAVAKAILQRGAVTVVDAAGCHGLLECETV